MKRKNWYKLDNAAQLFPMVSTSKEKNSFRLACVLTEEIDPDKLKSALELSLQRFPTFNVKLKKGYFWYYLEKNNAPVVIRNESPYFCESNDYSLQNNYPFNLSYYHNRISIEIFHALSDGFGGLEFFKAIIYNYLNLKGNKIQNKGEVLTKEIETLLDDSEDSFKYNYNNKIKKKKNEGKAYSIKGTKYDNNWTGVIHAVCNLQSLKKASKKYNATITEYLSALLLQSIHENYAKHATLKHPIRLFIPVNIRKYFSSKTLRNFALFIRTNSKFKKDISFEEILIHVKETFKEEVSKDKMLARLKTNIKLETNIFIRIIPLFIKKIFMKIGYKILGKNANTMSFSNLGLVNLPNDCTKFIERLEFANGASKSSPINCTAISYNNSCVITFTSCIIERNFQLFVIKSLINDDVELVVETNDLEVEHEKM